MLRVLTSAVTVLALAGAAASAQQSTGAAVYESVAPAVVFVETDDGHGSGLLLDSNAILTAAHVLYPNHWAARIVFPDGTELLEVPLIGWDLVADIAVLGPVQLDSPPAPPPFDTSGRLPVGADLFAIGYPGAVEPFPQPTISRGILSRYRRWAVQEATFLQTDAAIGDGQSGGVLVSAAGAVVGMTAFSDDSESFGLALSAADLLPRMTALLTGVDVPARRGTRYLAADVQDPPIRFDLDSLWMERAFVIVAQPYDEVSFAVQGDSDLAVTIVDGTGDVIAGVDENRPGATESISAVLDGSPPFLLQVEQFDDRKVRVQVAGDAPLVPLADADDGVTLELPVRHVGALDYPYDVDYYLIALDAGETVRVRVDSLLIDPYLQIDYRHSPDTTDDDDSGGGLFGLGAELVFQAETSRVYRFVIKDLGSDVGGYTLTVERVNS